jgi:hypothetical protein
MDDDLHRPSGRDRDQDDPPWLARIGPRRLALAIVALALAAVAGLLV